MPAMPWDTTTAHSRSTPATSLSTNPSASATTFLSSQTATTCRSGYQTPVAVYHLRQGTTCSNRSSRHDLKEPGWDCPSSGVSCMTTREPSRWLQCQTRERRSRYTFRPSPGPKHREGLARHPSPGRCLGQCGENRCSLWMTKILSAVLPSKSSQVSDITSCLLYTSDAADD